jgi:Na+/H+ antiporter NhaD/arsenite permease-like protein
MLALMLPAVSQAADLDGAGLSLAWALPFAGVLLSIAVLPLLAPALWHHHFGKIAGAWALAFLLPFAALHGRMRHWPSACMRWWRNIFLHHPADRALHRGRWHLRARQPAWHARAQYRIAGAGYLAGQPHGYDRRGHAADSSADPRQRQPQAHGPRGGVLHLPGRQCGWLAHALGDPPLFLGFLKGVDFFWTARHLLGPMAFLCGALLLVFYLLDRHFYLNREERRPLDPTPDSALRLEGKFNFLLLGAVVGLVLMSGLWKPGVATEVLGTPLEWQNLLRDGLLVGVILLSLWLTPTSARSGNDFGWGPMLEVGKLFAAIFLTIAPVIAMLRAGEQGAFAAVVRAVTGPDGKPDDVMYFWMTGLLSSFLDNAPTYLVFFNTASGDARELMGPLASTLAAISAGAVFMGANSYIGNAPNMMVKAIAEERGIRMPSFFGYMAWSVGILVPLFIVMSFLFF